MSLRGRQSSSAVEDEAEEGRGEKRLQLEEELRAQAEQEKEEEEQEHSLSVCTQLLGSLFAFLSVSFVSVNTLVIKKNPEINISWFLIAQGLTLGLIQSSLCVFHHTDKDAVSSLKQNVWGVLIKLAVIFVLLPILFRLIPEMPFGDLSVILTCAPCLLVAIFAYILFGEKLTQIQAFLIVLSFIGVAFILRPAFIFGSTKSDTVYPNRVMATGVCIGLSCLITAQILAVRKMGTSVSVYTLNCLIGFTLAISGAVYHNVFGTQPLYNHYFCDHPLYCSLLIVVSALFSSFISPLETLALQRTKAAIFTAIGTSKVILDYGLQLLFFPEEDIFWSTVVGACIVTITAFDLSLHIDEWALKWMRERKQRQIARNVQHLPTPPSNNPPGDNQETNC